MFHFAGRGGYNSREAIVQYQAVFFTIHSIKRPGNKASTYVASIQGRLKYGLVPIAGSDSAHALQITQNMGNRTTNVKP